jgi:site-specific recombinase XerC
MASIYKRGGNANRNGCYYVTYMVQPGVRRTVKGCRDRTATEAYARKLEADAFLRTHGVIDTAADRHAHAETTPLVVKDRNENVVGGHVADFYNNIVARATTETHATSRRSQVCRIIETCKAKQISQLTPSRVQSALQELRAKGLSYRTCNQHLGAIKQFSRWLWRDGRASEYALAHLAAYNEALDHRHDRRALTDEELRKLIEAAENGPELYGISGRDRAILYRIAAGTGFRRNEIRSLTQESFDLDVAPPTVTVEAAYSKHRRRDVQPIRRDLADLLRPWLAWKKPGHPIIETSEWNWDDSSKMIQADLATAKVPFKDARGRFADFHSLRHTYITNIGRLPVSLKTHQELARHSQPALTMRYTHTQLEDKVRALEALPAVKPAAENAAQNVAG